MMSYVRKSHEQGFIANKCNHCWESKTTLKVSGKVGEHKYDFCLVISVS